MLETGAARAPRRQNGAMASSFDVPMLVAGGDPLEVLRVSPPFVRALGWRSDDLVSQPLLEHVLAEDRAAFEEALKAREDSVRARLATPRGEVFEFDWRLREDDGGLFALGTSRAVGPSSSGAPAALGHLPRTTLERTLDAMARIVEAKNPGMRCSILLVDEADGRVVVGAGPSLPDAYNRAVEGLRIGPTVGSCGTAAYWNVPVIVEDIFEDPLWRDLRDAAEVAGVRACWSHPVCAANGDVLGAMALYSTQPGGPSQSQMDGLEIAARMVGLAVERDRLEAQLRQMAKMEALGVLAGGIAHDFNNMLAVVLGNAEYALSTLCSEEDVSGKLREIVTASVNATELCNQLLAYAGRGAISVEVIECNALVHELGGLLQVALSKKTSLDFQLSEASLGVQADRSQLRQVFMNLITNAAEAIGDRPGRIVIQSDARSYGRDELNALQPQGSLGAGEYVSIRVSDTGMGMESRTQSQIFDPFFTTKSTGRGLGLAAVRGIVKSHGGAIALESEMGRGTTFTVLLPRVPLPGGVGVRPAMPAQSLEGARVLVVDDEPGVRRVLINFLERAGCEVTEAVDGVVAVELFRRDPSAFDCVLLDLSMPRLGGDEVFRELRRIRPDIRVVLISGFTEQEVMNRFQGAGIAGFLQKPTQMKALLAKVSQVLDRREVEATV